MKKGRLKLTMVLVALCCGIQVSATTRTVNNTTVLPVNPGQYTTISAAVSAASNGDTILVTGTTTAYSESPTISKQLTIIGTGYSPQYQTPTVLNGYIYFEPGSSGSTFMGFNIQGFYVGYSGSVRNITIYRNYIANNWSILFYAACSNITIAENVIVDEVNLDGYNNDTNIVIKNNVFLMNSGIAITGGSTSSSTQSNVIDHNVFLAGSYSTPLTTSYTYAIQTTNAVISNNIFYGVVPIDTNNSSSYTSNIFYNNLTYANTTIKSLPWGGNIGSGNINNSNPLFTTGVFPDAGYPYFDVKTSNLRPQSGSPVINAANDGSNIGPTGGNYPIYNATVPWLTGEPPVPELESVIFTSSTAVPPGTPVNFQVKGKKIN